ncbi:MAG TPA: hypothetical protein ENJ33_07205 [Thiothrix sp.]|nr:hypothetical protein [Thiothrix sp.]
MNKIITQASLVIGLLAFSTAYAETNSKYALTAKIGTLGVGADLTYGMTDKLNARFSVNGGSISADGEEDGINYKGDLDLLSGGALVDYHPFISNFRLSAGLFANENEFNLDASGSNNAVIGARSYDLSNANLNTQIGFNSLAPYLGIGWGNAVKKGSQWRFSLDAGVLFQGSPEAKFTTSGTVDSGAGAISVNDSLFQNDLDQEEQNLNDELKDFKALPVISLGTSYRF